MSLERIHDIQSVLLEHLVLFFRNQPLTFDEHARLGRYFGELHRHPNAARPVEFPESMRVGTGPDTKRVPGDGWHSDVSCDPEPPLGSILHLKQVPSKGGDTLFASAYAVYESLSLGMRDYLAGLKAVHDGGPRYRARNALKGVDDSGKVYPKHAHPIVRTHPATGRKGIFVNAAYTTHIEGVLPSESDAMLKFLFSLFERPEFQVRWRWEPDSVAFWDNRSCQHCAIWDYFPEHRLGYRVTIQGDRPR